MNTETPLALIDLDESAMVWKGRIPDLNITITGFSQDEVNSRLRQIIFRWQRDNGYLPQPGLTRRIFRRIKHLTTFAQ